VTAGSLFGMTQLKVMVAAVVACGAATVLWLQHSFSERLRRENEVLRGVVAELDSIHRTRDPVVGSESLTRGQLDELLKLREEAARLGEQTNQIGVLVEANHRLVVTLKELRAVAEEGSKEKRPEDASAEDIHPTASWAFRGYATPEAALESLFWAEANEDKTAGRTRRTVGFRIVDRRQLSKDETVLKFYTDWYDAEGHIRFNEFNPTIFQRIDGEWKATDKHAPKD